MFLFLKRKRSQIFWERIWRSQIIQWKWS